MQKTYPVFLSLLVGFLLGSGLPLGKRAQGENVAPASFLASIRDVGAEFGPRNEVHLFLTQGRHRIELTDATAANLAQQLIQKARAIACDPHVSPADITLSALGFLDLTWTREDLCSTK